MLDHTASIQSKAIDSKIEGVKNNVSSFQAKKTTSFINKIVDSTVIELKNLMKVNGSLFSGATNLRNKSLPIRLDRLKTELVILAKSSNKTKTNHIYEKILNIEKKN